MYYLLDVLSKIQKDAQYIRERAVQSVKSGLVILATKHDVDACISEMLQSISSLDQKSPAALIYIKEIIHLVNSLKTAETSTHQIIYIGQPPICDFVSFSKA